MSTTEAINVDEIPILLRNHHQWVLWKIEARGGNPTKVPYSTKGTEGKSNDPATWASFEAAVKRYNRGGYAGIGFVFSADDPFTGVDLDGCRDPETGTIAPWASEIIEALDTYAEVSPSGTGIKLFALGKSPLATGKQKKLKDVEKTTDKPPGIEVYDHLRYFAVTGAVLSGPLEPQGRQGELDALVERFWPKQVLTVSTSGNGAATCGKSPTSLDVRKIQERARAYLKEIPGAVDGNGGHNATFHVACVLVCDFALSPDDAWGPFVEWNQKCKGPWSEGELRHKLQDADKQPGPRGKLLDRGDHNDHHANYGGRRDGQDVTGQNGLKQPDQNDQIRPKLTDGTEKRCGGDPNALLLAAADEHFVPSKPVLLKTNTTPDPDRALIPKPVIINMESIAAERIEWLWPARIPMGKFSLLIGNPGEGKSLLASYLCAQVTNGSLWPVSVDRAPQGRVLLICCEDDAADTIRPRLEAADADVALVDLWRGVEYSDPATGEPRERLLNLTTDMGMIADTLASGDYRLVVLDTLTGFMGKGDNNSSTDVRNALTPLSVLAAKHRVAIVGIQHLTKDNSKSAIYRTNGSIGYVAVARAALAVSRDHKDPDLRIVSQVKTNLGPMPATLGFRIKAPDGVPLIQWEPLPLDVDADEALGPAKTERKQTAKDRAGDWLREFLADGPQPVADIFENGDVFDHSEKSLRAACSDMNLGKVKTGMKGGWLWFLPEHEPLTREWASSASSGKTGGSDGHLRAWTPGEVGTFDVGQDVPEDGQEALEDAHREREDIPPY